MADSAFAGCAAIIPEHATTTAHAVDGRSVVSVTAWDRSPALANAIREKFALELPPPGRWTQASGLAALWAGPGHWWLQREGELGDLASLEPHAALIDISDARATLRLSGPDVRAVLASLVPLDLHPRVFQPGHVASTVASHIGVQLRQLDEMSYELSCLRSFARSLWRAVELAGAGRVRLNNRSDT